MPRVRLAVALLVPEPVATEIDGLRRALGDPGLANVVPHITLISPVNVAEDRVPDVLAVLRAAAANTAPMELGLGPPTTFLPTTPVAYLDVRSDGDVVHELRTALLVDPLARPAVHDFVPHVTINEECAPDRIEAALHAMPDYKVDVRVDRVHLLRDGAPGTHRWNAVADAVFERPLVVGRGGLTTEITVSGLADPELTPWFGDEPVFVPPGAESLVVTARRDGDIVAAARGWIAGGQPALVEVVGDNDVERQLLKAATQSAAGRS